MAGTRLPSHNLPTNTMPTNTEMAAVEAAGSAAVTAKAVAAATRMVTVQGRILNEKGQPLVGATVLRKGTHHGASTDANGNYALQVPASEATTATLQYGYAGYNDQEMKATSATFQGVTLKRQDVKRKHWLFF